MRIVFIVITSYSIHYTKLYDEYDHLEGIFFTDYLRGLRKRLVMPVLKKIRAGEADADYVMARKVEFAD